MIRAAVAEARFFQSWVDYQNALKRAITPLTRAQLQQRPLPGRRTPGEIAEHIVFGRALHLQRALGDGAAELTPFLAWDRSADPPRTAEEIVDGLDTTWDVIERALMSGSATAELPADGRESSVQAIWGLLDHDLPHAGQLSLLLRASGLPGVDV